MELEQDISDGSTAILDYKLLVIVYMSSALNEKFLKSCSKVRVLLVRRLLKLSVE